MIGMVLAAGVGTRLRPHTDRLPKTLIEVDGDRTILDIALGNLAKVGLADVVVVVGHAADVVRRRKVALERRHGVSLHLVVNDRAEQWNNAYSLWTARDLMVDGVLLVNGDTVHPVVVEEELLSGRGRGLLLAIDTGKPLADEEMKVETDSRGAVTRISKLIPPAEACGEYIGATLVEPVMVPRLVAALETTWRRDPDHYYEDAYQELVDRGDEVMTVPIPRDTEWVEVDEVSDLVRAREIAWRY